MMDLQLKGRVALVTGGARDVGAEIALTLAAEGASVAVNYSSSADAARDVVQKIKAGGGRAIGCKADVADYEAVTTMVRQVTQELGGLNILVNNAGVVLRKPFSETTPTDWKRQIDVGLYGAIHCCHAAAPHIAKSGNGRLISIVGDSSRVGESGLAIAAAARAGVIALMKSLAREMGRTGTTANTLALGLIETAHDPGWVDANRERLVKLYPLRRLGKSVDITPMVALLASDHAAWTTGQVISISGGFSMV
jgi:NAD(P)-dependent dehydrogenase (short-subunit alcohol dehydrogenase family)